MNDLTKLSVNLVPNSVAALGAAAEQTGLSETDTVNRALQVYALVMKHHSHGSGEVSFLHADGSTIRLAVNPRERRVSSWVDVTVAVVAILALVFVCVVCTYAAGGVR